MAKNTSKQARKPAVILLSGGLDSATAAAIPSRGMPAKTTSTEPFTVFTWIGAACAADALNRLNEETFDCIVLDLRLPDMSGFEFIRKLKNDLGRNDIPIVIVDLEMKLRRFTPAADRGWVKDHLVRWDQAVAKA